MNTQFVQKCFNETEGLKDTNAIDSLTNCFFILPEY